MCAAAVLDLIWQVLLGAVIASRSASHNSPIAAQGVRRDIAI